MSDVACKGGTKTALLNYAQQKAEKLEAVRNRVIELVRGKSLVGYHLPQKMADLGLLTADIGGMPLYDVAKIFNAEESGQQTPVTTLTEKYLNLNYKKRPSPVYAFTDAKIGMALFKQWEKLQKVAGKEQMPFGEIDQNSGSSGNEKGSTADVEACDQDEVIVLDGARLKSLIKDYARECIREELANVLKLLTIN